MKTLETTQTKTNQIDVILLTVTVILCIISILAVYSAVGNHAYMKEKSTVYFLTRQLLLVVIGLVMMYLITRLKYFSLARFGQLFIFISIFLLIYTMFWGLKVNGVRRWISIFGLTFQPSDFAKVSVIIYISGWIEKYRQKLNTFDYRLLIHLWPVPVISALIFPSNFSTAALVFAISIALLILMNVKRHYWLGLTGISASVAGLLFLINIFVTILPRSEDNTWGNRISQHFAPPPVNAEPEDLTQKDYITIAVATGGLFGKMPGKSSMRIFIANGFSDFIYAIIIEEYGLVGGVLIVLLFLIFLYRSIRIAMKSSTDFGMCLAIGLSAMIMIQAFVHMCISVGILPVTGQTLPLISMGGTSMWFMLMAIGLLQSIYYHKESENQELHVNQIKVNG